VIIMTESRAAKGWTVSVLIDEHNGRTRAVARLNTGARPTLTGTGTARLNPSDRDVPEIGDELATARALSHLAHRLLEATADDIAGVTHEDVSLEDVR